jgi:hypothetical protein
MQQLAAKPKPKPPPPPRLHGHQRRYQGHEPRRRRGPIDVARVSPRYPPNAVGASTGSTTALTSSKYNGVHGTPSIARRRTLYECICQWQFRTMERDRTRLQSIAVRQTAAPHAREGCCCRVVLSARCPPTPALGLCLIEHPSSGAPVRPRPGLLICPTTTP